MSFGQRKITPFSLKTTQHFIYNLFIIYLIMAKAKIKFRPSSISGREGTLYYQVSHKRLTRQICSGYKVFPDEWDAGRSQLVFSGTDRERAMHLRLLKEALQADIQKIRNIIAQFDKTEEPYSTLQIVDQFRQQRDDLEFLSFSRNLIEQLKELGKMETAATYTATLNSFRRFRANRDLLLEDVDSKLMMEYESWLKRNKVCKNSTSFYMRNLRAIYNRAVERELTTQKHPFKHVYTGIDKTRKRAVTIDIIRKIKELDLMHSPKHDFARDLFLFSFYTRGMSFIDMAYMKKTDLQNGMLSYRRHKTNQQLFIKWEEPMQRIIDKYNTAGSPFLLPIIRDLNCDERRQYKTVAHMVNRKLKELGERIGLGESLTSYVARHAWASIAKSKGVPLSTISAAMGHDSENTTRIYLATLDTASVNNANAMVLNLL